MPLEPYLRNGFWWAKGKVTYEGKPISERYRCSTGAPSEQAAWQWCREEEARVTKLHLLGPDAKKLEEKTFTFGQAVLLYDTTSKTAKYLIPIVEKWASKPISEINSNSIKALARDLYPEAGTATWTRHVVTPIRSVINNAHYAGLCPPLQFQGFDRQEKARQDKKRGSTGRKKYPPGSWEWMLQFCEHAEPRVKALAMTMFCTGCRISQAMEMHPDDYDQKQAKLRVPGAKGLEARWLDVPEWLAEVLDALPPTLYPRGWERVPANRRLFGYAERSSPRKAWNKAIEKAGIEFIPFHSSGRHGFGQETNVRHPVDEKAAAAFGGWADISLMKKTYTHAEEAAPKIHAAQKAGRERAKAKLKARKSR